MDGARQCTNANSVYARVAKPVLDRVAALTLLVALAPLLAVITLVVRVTLGPGVLFRQPRVGRHGRVFTMYKFRTMQPDRRIATTPIAGTDRRVAIVSDSDPRHTRAGQWLRRRGLDELPQLWNVLRGDMSLVGPRPEMPAYVARYEPWEHRRHSVRPGITGLWQVAHRAGDVPMEALVRVDLDYVERISFTLDVQLVGRSLAGVFARS
jgi:lipopolysaccharide/colanic/teichoic acid biosynthesis glycosyltransferase